MTTRVFTPNTLIRFFEENHVIGEWRGRLWYPVPQLIPPGELEAFEDRVTAAGYFSECDLRRLSWMRCKERDVTYDGEIPHNVIEAATELIHREALADLVYECALLAEGQQPQLTSREGPGDPDAQPEDEGGDAGPEQA